MTDAAAALRPLVDVLGLASAYLDSRGSASPRLDAELLLGRVLGLSRLELYLHHDRPLEPVELDRFRELIRRRGTGEPVAYLLGERGFRRLVLRSDRRALVPRPETEALVEVAVAALPVGGSLLDVGTGSGNVARRGRRRAAGRRHRRRRRLARRPGAGRGERRGARAGPRAAAALGPLRRPRRRALPRHRGEPPVRRRGRPGAGARRGGPRAAGGPVRRRRRARPGAPGHRRRAGVPASPRGLLALEIGAGQAPAVRDLLAAAGFGELRPRATWPASSASSRGGCRGRRDAHAEPRRRPRAARRRVPRRPPDDRPDRHGLRHRDGRARARRAASGCRG